jgi:lactate permease
MAPEPTVPVNLLFWLLALTPLAVLLALLVVFRWQAAQAGPVGYLVAAAIALLFFRTPMLTLAISTAKGFWDAVFILYVVWTALALYEVAGAANVFTVFCRGIRAFTPNRLVHLFAFGLVFLLFVQATAGFGTPIAVVAPLLVGLGIRPVYAVALALIGHVWGNSFGVLAIAWLAMNLVVGVAQPAVTVVVAAVLLAVAVLAGALTLAYVYGGRRALLESAPLIVVLAAIYGLGQLAIVPFVPELAAIVPAIASLGAIYWLGKRPVYQQEMVADVRPEITDGRGVGCEPAAEEARVAETTGLERAEPPLRVAFVPYYGLVFFLLAGLVLTQTVPALDGIRLGPGFPATTTGFDVTRPAVAVYSGLNPIDHPGTSILLSVLVGYLVFVVRGYIPRGGWRPLLGRVAQNAVPTSVAVVGFLAMTTTMDGSGQIFSLSRGVAAVLPPAVYAGASVLIGALGSFMTSSNTASNILFSPVQVEASQALGISQGLVLGGQTAGGAYGNAIAPANVSLGTGSAGIPGEEGEVLRLTLPWTLGLTLIGGLILAGLHLLA